MKSEVRDETKDDVIRLLCERVGNMRTAEEINYPRIEELAYLILQIIKEH